MIKLNLRNSDGRAGDEATVECQAGDEFVGDHGPSDRVANGKEATPDADTDSGPDVGDHGVDATVVGPGGIGINWPQIFAYAVLPALVLVLGLAASWLKWMDSSVRTAGSAGIESVQTAKDSTVALLSYTPDTVGRDLVAARDMLTGDFRDSYTQLTDDVVIPAAEQQQISAVATVPAAASVSASPNHAVVIVFVDQTTTIGTGRPTDTASSVRVTLEKVGDRWLVSGFDPV